VSESPVVRSAFSVVEAESAVQVHGGEVAGGVVTGLGDGDWLDLGLVDFAGGPAHQVYSLVAAGSSGSGLVRYRLDSVSGPVLGEFSIADTGGWSSFKQVPANAGGGSGVHRLFVTFESGYRGDFVSLDRLQLAPRGAPVPDLAQVTQPSPTPTPSPSQSTPTATPTPTPSQPTPTPSPSQSTPTASPTPSQTSTSPSPSPTPSSGPGEWNLVWSDEFDGESGAAPDADKWTAEQGGWGWGNQEWQYYTDSRENSAQSGDGDLKITARQGGAGQQCWYGPCSHTSARLVTKGKFEQQYGRVEARIKLPEGQGIWPAFWMLGSDFPETAWPNSGEIDIMENIGKEPGTAYGNIHGPGYSGCCGIVGSTTLPDGEKLADAFHRFAIEWDENSITWFLDDQPFHRATKSDIPAGTQWVFDHEFFILLNVAVGGSWPGYPDATTQFPQSMTVDYVRVYASDDPGPAVKPARERIEAEDYDAQSGVRAEASEDTDAGRNIGWIANGDWAQYRRVDFGHDAPSSLRMRLANGSGLTGNVEVRLDAPDGELIATMPAAPTGGWQTWETAQANLTQPVTGEHDVYLVASGAPSGDDFININWFRFTD